jgi:L-amino acid N-acyltransferase YncA
MLSIYAPIVRDTAISFEVAVPSEAEFGERVRTTTQELPWLVAETSEAGVVGYAYASRHADRAAYRWSVDVSLYVAASARGQGVGAALYSALIDAVRSLGYVSAYAGIALPNDASVAVHEKLGFVCIGRFPNVGYKHGAWHEVGWWYLALRERPTSPPEPSIWRSD